MHEELELELGSHLGPKFELRFFFVCFYCKPCQPTFKFESNSIACEESKFKLASRLGFEVEFELFFFLVPSPIELLLALKIV